MRSLALLLTALAAGGCVPMPVQVAPALGGRVVDAATSAPIAEGLVLARIERRYDEVLPERELLDARVVRTDAAGRYRIPRSVHPGLSVWPWAAAEVRVLAVAPGYRCSPLTPAVAGDPLQIALETARDTGDRTRSCQAIDALWASARRLPALRSALAELGLDAPPPARARAADERTLAARAAFGFGANCRGPVLDLALAPDGRHAAYVALDGGRRRVHVVALDGAGSRAARPIQIEVPSSALSSHEELVFTGPNVLALQAPGRDDFVPIWSHAPPAAPARDAGRLPASPAPAIHPEDRHDADDVRWLGRFFAISRDVDPTTGLPRDLLHVTEPGGRERTLALPGEACTHEGRFGRPHYRIVAGGRYGLDLRFVGGACRAVRIDLETGDWLPLDATAAPAVCRGERRVLPALLGLAFRDYARELETLLSTAGADAAAYTLEIGEGAAVVVETRSVGGAAQRLAASPFPVATPLRRIDVSIVGPAR